MVSRTGDDEDAGERVVWDKTSESEIKSERERERDHETPAESGLDHLCQALFARLEAPVYLSFGLLNIQTLFHPLSLLRTVVLSHPGSCSTRCPLRRLIAFHGSEHERDQATARVTLK